MHDRAKNLAVGITAVAGVVGLCALMWLFGYMPQWLEGSYEVKVQFANSGGMVPGSRVTLSGLDVGRITQVRLQTLPARGVVVTALVRDEFKIPVDVIAIVDSPLIGGSPALGLLIEDLDDQQLKNLLPTDGTATLTGQTDSMLSQLSTELRIAIAESIDLLDDRLKEPKERLFKLEESIRQLSDQWTKVGKNVNQLVESRSPDAVDNGEATANLSTVIVRTDKNMAELHETITQLNAWLSDKSIKEDVKATLANARRVSDRVDEGSKMLLTTIETTGRKVETLAKKYAALADDIGAAVAQAQGVLKKADVGDGTVGRLLNNPELYDNLNDSAQSVENAIDELKLLLQKWKEEGVPIRLFD